jgi:hypothetical protein
VIDFGVHRSLRKPKVDREYREQARRRGIERAVRDVPKPADVVREVIQKDNLNLYELTSEVCSAILATKREALSGTLADMAEMGLLHLPHPEIAIRVRFSDVGYKNTELNDKVGPNRFVTFRVREPLRIEDGVAVGEIGNKILLEDGWQVKAATVGEKADEKELHDFYVLVTSILVLALALASPNIVKRDRLKEARKQSRIGLQSGPFGTHYISRTRVELPPQMETVPGSHASPRPHLRRGHIHTVVHGKGRTERRPEWFPPVFVNGDPNFAPKPRTHKVTE